MHPITFPGGKRRADLMEPHGSWRKRQLREAISDIWAVIGAGKLMIFATLVQRTVRHRGARGLKKPVSPNRRGGHVLPQAAADPRATIALHH